VQQIASGNACNRNNCVNPLTTCAQCTKAGMHACPVGGTCP
jgi:hypothetical protein